MLVKWTAAAAVDGGRGCATAAAGEIFPFDSPTRAPSDSFLPVFILFCSYGLVVQDGGDSSTSTATTIGIRGLQAARM